MSKLTYIILFAAVNTSLILLLLFGINPTPINKEIYFLQLLILVIIIKGIMRKRLGYSFINYDHPFSKKFWKEYISLFTH